jgi:hypothetical protein
MTDFNIHHSLFDVHYLTTTYLRYYASQLLRSTLTLAIPPSSLRTPIITKLFLYYRQICRAESRFTAALPTFIRLYPANGRSRPQHVCAYPPQNTGLASALALLCLCPRKQVAGLIPTKVRPRHPLSSRPKAAARRRRRRKPTCGGLCQRKITLSLHICRCVLTPAVLSTRDALSTVKQAGYDKLR